jgi:pre-mRNA-splicing factor ATP-dependent RNA helicase DHX15/PRP43
MSERKRKLDVGWDVSSSSQAAPVSASSVDSSVNPWTGRPYTQQYLNILEKRKGLPVWEQRDAFLATVAKHQVRAYLCYTNMCV